MKFPWQRLRAQGILGMNQRNADFIMPYNQRRYYPLVDDKRITKEAAQAHQIAVPELYTVIEINHQIAQFESLVAAYDDFVIKPANGSGGNGILVITGRHHSGGFTRANGNLISVDEVQFHLSNILSGMYSLGGHADTAIIEYRVQFDDCFADISYRGVPDIRTIVFRGIPVMAMLRLPTLRSDGRANLHQGAIGVGIDLVKGETTQSVYKNNLVSRHPDTGTKVAGLVIPHWQKILHMAARCHQIAKLDYLGVDIVLDRNLGPLMLELNARPGLNIQLCNDIGLLPRLNKIAALKSIPENIINRVRLGALLTDQIDDN